MITTPTINGNSEFSLAHALTAVQLNITAAAISIGLKENPERVIGDLDIALTNLLTIKTYLTEQLLMSKKNDSGNYTKKPIPQGTEIPKDNQGVKPSKPGGKTVEPKSKK